MIEPGIVDMNIANAAVADKNTAVAAVIVDIAVAVVDNELNDRLDEDDSGQKLASLVASVSLSC